MPLFLMQIHPAPAKRSGSVKFLDPEVIAADVVEDLEAALQQFAAIAQDLKK